MARNPLTAVPATRSSLPLLQIRRRLVIGVLSLSVASGVFSTIAWLTHGGSAPLPAQGPDQMAIALAETAVQDFLAARTSAVPAAAEVNNDFSKVDGTEDARVALEATNLTYAGTTTVALGDADVAPLVTAQEKFTATIDGQLYALTVPMVSTGKGEWLLGATPAITPEPVAANQTLDGIDYTQLYSSLDSGDGAALPEAYLTAIKEWASTFATAGHADGNLLRLTGDESTTHTYSGLGGWSVVGDPEVKSFAPVPAPDPGFIVRVGLVLHSPAANGPTLSTEYDVYLRSDKSQQQPPVVAWGAAGSYRTLTPYMNVDQP